MIGNSNIHVGPSTITFQTGLTALHVAAQFGQIDFVREMLAKVPATVRSEPPHTGEGMHRDIAAEVGLDINVVLDIW